MKTFFLNIDYKYECLSLQSDTVSVVGFFLVSGSLYSIPCKPFLT